MVCEVCGKRGARIRRKARNYGTGKNLWVIKNVPVVACPHCGESYLTAATIHEIDRLKRRRKTSSQHIVQFAKRLGVS